MTLIWFWALQVLATPLTPDALVGAIASTGDIEGLAHIAAVSFLLDAPEDPVIEVEAVEEAIIRLQKITAPDKRPVRG